MDESYLDYLQTLDTVEVGDSLKDLMRENFSAFSHYLDGLYHVEATCIYLNVVCRVPQKKVARMLGISQYGVSKRVRSGIDKLPHLLRSPERDRVVVKADLFELLPPVTAEVVFVYYHLNTYSWSGRILGRSSCTVKDIVKRGLSTLRSLADSTSVLEYRDAYLEDSNSKEKESKDATLARISHILSDNEVYMQKKLTASRYLTYLRGVSSRTSYGCYTFKKYDSKRVR